MTKNLQNLALDDDGHLLNAEDWSPTLAQTLADTLEITLAEEHFAILTTVREFYQQFGHPPNHSPAD